METEEIFMILELEQTKDEQAIKAAYRKKLAVTNPEDNPEGFKRLRKAYELALEYSKQSDEEPVQEDDTTPSGLWVEKAKNIYKNIHTRQDKALWEQLFEDDVFLSIEGEELCREKLLVFMMANYFFPTEIWKFLDEKLNICKDSVALKEKFPAEFIDFMVRKCQRGEDIEFASFDGPDEGDYDRYIQMYIQCWNALDDNNAELAKQIHDEAQQLDCHHPVMDLIHAFIMKAQGQENEALTYLGSVYEKYPKDITIAFNYGDLCWKMNEKDRAAQVFLGIKEDYNEHYMSNFYLTEWYRDKGEYKKAKECGEKVMATDGSNEFYEMMCDINRKLMEEYNRKYIEENDVDAAEELCWCYLQNEESYKGLKIAEKLEVQKDKLASHYSLLTKLYFEMGLYEKSLESALLWRKALKERMENEEGDELAADKDRLYQTYATRIRAYHQMGYRKKEYLAEALGEADALSLIEELGPYMLLEKAQIYIDNDEPAKAVELANKVINEKQQFNAYATLMLAYVKQLDAGGVIKACEACNYYFPRYAKAYEESARVYHDLEYTEELKALLEKAKKNGIKSPYLEAYEYQLENPSKKEDKKKSLDDEMDEFEENYYKPVSTSHDMKLFEKGLKEITRLLYENPGTYLLNSRGRYLFLANKFDEAKADFEKNLESYPYAEYELNMLGCTFKYTQEYEKALVCFIQAIRYMGDEVDKYPYRNLAHTLEKMGEYGNAAIVYQKMVDLFPESKAMVESVARNHARSNNKELALELIEKNKADKDFCNDNIQYHMYRYDVYKYADDMEGTKKTVADIDAELKKSSPVERSKWNTDISHKQAWQLLLMGKIDEALAIFKDVLTKDSPDEIVISERCDTIIFILTIKEYLKKHNMKNHKKSIWEIVKNRPGADKQDVSYYAGKIKVNTDNKNMIYRQRYAAYLNFIRVLYTQPKEGAKTNKEIIAAFDNLKNALRCRHCDDGGCINLQLATGLYLERQGKYNEALTIYRKLQETCPYDWYSKAKLLYMEEE